MNTCTQTQLTLDDLEKVAFETRGMVVRYLCPSCGGDKYSVETVMDGRSVELLAHSPIQTLVHAPKAVA